MGIRRLWAVAALCAIPLLADDRVKQILSSSQNQQFTLTAAGSIHLENSFGEVDIDGWDKPEVQITVVRSTEHYYGEKDRAEAQSRLDAVRVAWKQNGNDVVISTSYPPRNWFLHPLSRRSDIDITYRIKAPYDSKLVVDHNSGGVNVSDIRGDVRAKVINGQITLTLPPDEKYSLDAEAKLGDVYSDFGGQEQRRRVLGQEFTSGNTASPTKLELRVRVGDIVIQKRNNPPEQ